MENPPLPGECKPNTCEAGYIGNLCHIQVEKCTRTGLRCHAHADCIKRKRNRISIFRRRRKKNKSYCLCRSGYTGDGYSCTEINPCQTEDFACHLEASCVKIAPGQAKCMCTEGWVGDGYYCYPSTTCKVDEEYGCHVDAKCVTIGPGQAHCECNSGNHGNGSYCVATDMCKVNNGGCHRNAHCNATGPGKVSCNCVTGLGGDGFSCFGDIVFEVEMRRELTQIKALLKNIPAEDDFLIIKELNLTFFAPNNSAVLSFLSKTDSAWTKSEANLLTLLSYHAVPGIFTISNLNDSVGESLQPLAKQYKLNVSIDTDTVVVNDAEIIDGDIWALNGIIHIIDTVLEPFPPPIVVLNVADTLNQRTEFSIFSYFLKKTGLLNDLEADVRYTIFAPLNKAWKTFDLKEVTRRYLSYYIISSNALSKLDLQKQEDQYFPTLLGRNIQVKCDGKQIFLNGEEVNIKVPDLNSLAGYIHGINYLLNPVLNVCGKTDRDTDCCPGYFGMSCQECPGGSEHACSGHGECADSMGGDGSCTCSPDYTGVACDRCKQGIKCTLDDPCMLKNGNCGAFANCSSGPNWVRCNCILGYIDDGGTCKSPCEIINGGCHANATCQLEGEGVLCECLPDYVGDGRQCVHSLGKCGEINGGCSTRAQCKLFYPDNLEDEKVMCSCLPDFVGNGYTCHGNLWLTLQDLAAERPILMELITKMKGSKVTELLKADNDEQKNLTLFIPLYGDVEKIDPESYTVNGYILLDNNVDHNFVLHTLDGDNLEVKIDYNNSETDELEFRVNGVFVIQRNIIATNGIIHLVNNTVGQKLNWLTEPTNIFQHKHALSILGAVVILASIALVIVILVVAWNKRFIIQDTWAQLVGRHGNFTFRKFQDDNSPTTMSFHAGSPGGIENEGFVDSTN